MSSSRPRPSGIDGSTRRQTETEGKTKRGFTEFELAAAAWREQHQGVINKKSGPPRNRSYRSRSRSVSRNRHRSSSPRDRKKRKDRSRSRSRDSRHDKKKKKEEGRHRRKRSSSPADVSPRGRSPRAERLAIERRRREGPTYSPYRGNTAPASYEANEAADRPQRRRSPSPASSRSRSPIEASGRRRSGSFSSSSSIEGRVNDPWNHDKFVRQAEPSPERRVPTGYRPPSPEWVSRAGGVAIMKKRSARDNEEGSRNL